MRNLFVGLLWLWLFVSLGIYGYRLYRRFTRPKADAATDDGTAIRPSSEAPIVGGRDVPPRVPPPVAPVAPIEPARPLAPPPVVGSRTEPPVLPPRDPAPGRSGLFAPRAPSPSPAGGVEAGAEARPTVADVLTGISMPCDLAPIVDATRVFDPYRVAFSTHTASAPTVGAAVADELERLAFSLQSTADNQLDAVKEAKRVTVTIHADPEAVHYADGQAFPTMPPDSVVVEFQT